jgi:hypothetical protein
VSLDLPDSVLPEAAAAGLGGLPEAEADRALAALRLLAALGTAWCGSGLTGDGFPLELGFTTADPALRWTFDPAPPGLPPAARLDVALAGLSRVGAPLEPRLARLARRLQAGREQGFGAWLGGRHDAEGDRYKLYVELADGPGAEAALRAFGMPRPQLARATPRTRMLGLGPGPDRAEVYFRVEANRHDLPRLLDPAGRADDAGPLAALLEEAWGHAIRDRLPGGQVGVSYARSGSARPAVTLFFFARTLWGGDARIRERMLARLAEAGAPAGPYAAASTPVADRRSAQTRHGLVGITLAPGAVAWSVGLRPVSPPC